MAGKRGLDLICAALLVVLWLVLWIPRLSGPIDLRWDAGTYYVLGTALSEGKGYLLLNEPGNIEAVQYPPLLPFIVAAHQRLMGTTDYIRVGCTLRITYFVLSGLLVLAAYSVVRKLLAPFYALLVAVSTALSFYSFLHPSDILYAEMPFALVAMLFLLCHKKQTGPLRFGTMGLLGGAVYLLRTAGLALLLAWITESLVRRRFGELAIRTTVSALPILIWQAHVRQVTASEGYRHPPYSYQRAAYNYSNVTYAENAKLVDPFRPELGRISPGQMISRLTSNLTVVPLALGESAIVPSDFQLLRGHSRTSWCVLATSLIAAGIVTIAGVVLVASGSEWFLALYFGLTILLMVLTPWRNQFWRYFAPVAPLTIMFFAVALINFQRWLRKRAGKFMQNVTLVLTVCIAAGILSLQAAIMSYFLRNLQPVSYYDSAGREQAFRLLTYGRSWQAIDQAFEWIRRNGTANTIVGTTLPQLAYLRSGHKAVLPPLEVNPATAQHLLDEVPVTYLVLDHVIGPQISERYTAPTVAQNSSDWHLVFTAFDRRTQVYARSH